MSIPVGTVLDITARSSLIQKRRMDPACRLRAIQSPRPLDASKRVMNFCGIIHLAVTIGMFQAEAPLREERNLAVNCLLAMSFIESHARAALPTPQDICFYLSSSVAITGLFFLKKPKNLALLNLNTGSEKKGQRGK